MRGKGAGAGAGGGGRGVHLTLLPILGHCFYTVHITELFFGVPERKKVLSNILSIFLIFLALLKLKNVKLMFFFSCECVWVRCPINHSFAKIFLIKSDFWQADNKPISLHKQCTTALETRFYSVLLTNFSQNGVTCDYHPEKKGKRAGKGHVHRWSKGFEN